MLEAFKTRKIGRNDDPLNQRSNSKSDWLYIIIIPLLFYIPVLHYMLDMIIGLVENSAWTEDHFDSASAFSNWLHKNFVDFNDNTGRYKPFMEFWNGLIWKLFSPADWILYLSRFALLIVAVSFFAAAFMHISKQADNQLGIIPTLLVVYLFLFFPNVPFIRFEAAELYTILFLGVCNWAMALMLAAEKFHAKHKALFYIGFLGLVLSKETNVALGLFILAFYWALTIAKGSLRQNWKGGAALTLALLAAIIGVKTALEVSTSQGSYFITSMPINERFRMNTLEMLLELFQYQTSAVIAAVFIFLLIVLIITFAERLAKRIFNGELAFILLLTGEFASLFLILSLSYGLTLRYWSPLIPLLSALVAFGAKFLLETVKHRKIYSKCAAAALIVFISYFVVINYYNFLHQTITFHSSRDTEEELLTKIANLLHDGQYVQASTYDLMETDPHVKEELSNLLSPWTYDRYFSNSPYERNAIHTMPPENMQQPYYLAVMLNKPNPIMETHAHLAGRSDYGILNHAGKVAGFLQGKSPLISKSWNVYPLGQYHWTIYSLPYNLESYLSSLVQGSSEPIAHSVFDVHLADNSIVYVKSPCAKADIQATFFLHYYPARESDLPQERRRHGFNIVDFTFQTQGFLTSEGTCFAAKALPDYPVTAIRMGQCDEPHKTCRPIWERFHSFANPDALNKIRKLRQGSRQPAIRSDFDVFLDQDAPRGGRQLIYAKQGCSQEEYERWFFLHLVPANPDDLPDERRSNGFVNLDFPIRRHGGRMGEECLAFVPLPDYGIASIRTGQVDDSRGEIWGGLMQLPDLVEALRAAYEAIVSGQPAESAPPAARGAEAHSEFNVQLDADTLSYFKAPCVAADTEAMFFLHVFPQDENDLPERRRQHGFDNLDFRFEQRGAQFDGKCMARVPLPGYAIARIRTGQYTDAGMVWAAEIRRLP